MGSLEFYGVWIACYGVHLLYSIVRYGSTQYTITTVTWAWILLGWVPAYIIFLITK